MSRDFAGPDRFRVLITRIEAADLSPNDLFTATLLARWINYLEQTADLETAIAGLRRQLDALLDDEGA